MAGSHHRRVIVAGGSIAGLVLANCLQAAEIDFLVLEKGEIAPQLGASVGMYPHGNNILQQLGVYQDIEALAHPLVQGYAWDDTNTKFGGKSVIYDMMREKSGYPVIFIQRQQYLQVLYSHIRDKSKVLKHKKVVSYDETEDGVKVITQDGDSYEGTILVGADGVHSTVRALMAEKALAAGNKASSSAFSCTDNGKFGYQNSYKSIFAVSRSNEKECSTPPGSVYYSHAKGHSTIVAAGAPGVIYWFLFAKIPDTRAERAPGYTEADINATLEELGGFKMCDKYTVREAWDARIAGNMLVLEEGIIDKWSRGRVVLVGDAIHKMTINAGLGANTAIEGIVTLMNLLQPILSPKSPREGALSTEKCEELFAAFHSAHLVRTKQVAAFAAAAPRLEAWENILWRLACRYVLPFLGDGFKFKRLQPLLFNAPKLNYLPKDPTRPING